MEDTFFDLTGSNNLKEIEIFTELIIEKADQCMADLTNIYNYIYSTINI